MDSRQGAGRPGEAGVSQTEVPAVGPRVQAAVRPHRGHFYARMAARNVRQNAQAYVPYIITWVCCLAMFYIVSALAMDPNSGEVAGMFLRLGAWVMGIFSVGFLFYTHSFLMKRRKKELGLMSVLGMEKRHIARVIALENLFVFAAAVVLGLGAGLILSRGAHALLGLVLRFDLRYSFGVCWPAMANALALFGGIFVLLLVHALWQVAAARPIELLKGGQTGEREPPARWLIALVGVLCLGGGYFISVTTKEPVMAIMLFFVAVVLVIIGTYCLFMAGSVALLKLLRRNKDYYYKANHFISVSGLMYRMKQNAAGLATICILSTMVLVMLSSTAALYFGMEDALSARYVREIAVPYGNPAAAEDIEGAVEDTLARHGLTARRTLSYQAMSLFGALEGDGIRLDGMWGAGDGWVEMTVLSAEDYPAALGVAAPGPGQALLMTGGDRYGRETLTLAGLSYTVTERAERPELIDPSAAYNASTTPQWVLVLPDRAAVEALEAAVAAQPDSAMEPAVYLSLGFDLGGEDAAQLAFAQELSQALDAAGAMSYVATRAESRAEFLGLYGGLFFLGIFLGLVFLMATVLIIYYKQLSEGYDDSRRFVIMQQVGLSRREARRAINAQMLTMFFLPLAGACLHMAFAFPALTRMLALLNLQSWTVFLTATVVAAAAFALWYMAVYRLTARVYYRLTEV